MKNITFQKIAHQTGYQCSTLSCHFNNVDTLIRIKSQYKKIINEKCNKTNLFTNEYVEDCNCILKAKI